MVLYFLNFLFISLSIALFFLPFLIWYGYVSQSKLVINYSNEYLEKFFSSPQANWLIFVWAASEAVIWFVIPEFLLLLVVFMRIRRKRQMLVYDIAGTLFGTVIALLMRLPERLVNQLPFVQQKMVDQTKLWYDKDGLLGLAHQPFSGVPYKVFTHLAWQNRFSLLLFLVAAVAVRIIRYLIAYGLFLSLYPRLHKVVRKDYLRLALFATLIFSVLLLKTFNHFQ